MVENVIVFSHQRIAGKGIVQKSFSGFALDNDDSEAGSIVSCTTEKGRHKCKNHRTAGNEQYL